MSGGMKKSGDFMILMKSIRIKKVIQLRFKEQSKMFIQDIELNKQLEKEIIEICRKKKNK